ncbi:hypothetical protein [Gemmata massiliana]|uniref:hypothetical protein n=1 Tax=Gemmata massiliana TaxID=1210884 RepID=UPI0013A6BA0B|nr:hypothetical protein [Gemmata massiliana]
MTEAEWLACDSPVALLALLNADGYSRKLLLYASALCALRPDLLTETLRRWSSLVDAVLTGEERPGAMDEWQESAEDECSELADSGPPETRAYYSVLAQVVFCSWINDPKELDIPPPVVVGIGPMRRTASNLIRDIFGNPFRPVVFSPS